MSRDILVIVPALNESECIAEVVTTARAVLDADVLVVDDGSDDETAEKAAAAGATVITHPYNLGVGAAVRTAMRYGTGRRYGVVLQLDGDGQHDPEAAGQLVAAVRSGSDVVVGSRFSAGYDLSLGRRLMMRFLSRVVSSSIDYEITDTTSGFRAFSPRAVRYFARHYPTDYLSDTVESLLLAADAGLAIAEVDVTMRQRAGGRPSARPLKAGYYLIRLLLILMLHRARRPLPKEEGHDLRP